METSRATASCATRRTFMTTPSFYAELPEPNATVSTSIPPVVPQRAERGPSSSKIPVNIKAAAEIRRVAGRATETYTAYGVTENLFQECAKQANYIIPQAADNDAEMPKTEDGEDLGLGDGWWHTGTEAWTRIK